MAEISALKNDIPLWNRVQLPPPPELSLPYSEAELATVLPVCHAVPAELGSQLAAGLHALLNELHLLRSIAYRVGNQFSNCRAFGGVRAVTACGRRLRQVAEPDWLAQRTAALARPQRQAGRAALPSRQLAQHLLVTCQRASRLLSRLAELAERAARLWLQWLRLGHQAPLAVAFLGLLGRVWDLSRVGRARLCRLYGAVLPLPPALREAGAPWPHEPLPACLWTWLGLEAGEGEDRPSVAAGGSLRAARRRHDELPFQDQSREITVSLLSAGGGCLDQTFAGRRRQGNRTDARMEVSESDAERGDRLVADHDNATSIEDIGEVVLEEDQGEPTSVEDLGELVDEDDMFVNGNFSPPVENGGVMSVECVIDCSPEENGGEQSSEENGVVQASDELQRESAAPKSPSDAAGDRKLYRRVNKLTRLWKTREDVATFVQQESEARRQDRKQCVTARLSNAQWKLVKQGLKENRVKWSKREKRGDVVGVEKVAKRSKLFVKTWSLFPSSEGRKPADWAAFLDGVKNKRPSC